MKTASIGLVAVIVVAASQLFAADQALSKNELSARWKKTKKIEDFHVLREKYLSPGTTEKELVDTLGKPISEHTAEDGVKNFFYVRIDPSRKQYHAWSCEVGADGKLVRWRKKGMR